MFIPMTIRDETLHLRIVVAAYRDGNLLVRLVDQDGAPFYTASLTFPGLRLGEGEFAFKTYAENEGLLEAMTAAGAVARTGRAILLPVVGGAAPVCRLCRVTTRPRRGGDE